MPRADIDQIKVIEKAGGVFADIIRFLQENLTNGSAFIGSIEQSGDSKYYVKVAKDGSQLIINNMRLDDGSLIDVNICVKKIGIQPTLSN